MADPRNNAIQLRAIVWVGVSIVLTIALVGGAAYWLWSDQLPSPWRDEPNTHLNFKIAAPLLDSAPQPGRIAYYAEKQRELERWQWVDRGAGVARIPVEQAMQLMAQSQAANVRGDKEESQ
jgi:hypothetical protein